MAMVKGLGVLTEVQVTEVNITETRISLTCTEDQKVSAFLLTSLGVLGIVANFLLIVVISFRRSFKSWSNGLLFHQAVVDLARSAILIPMGQSILQCQPISKCSLVETTFLLLVTVSTVNLLSVILNDAPILPEEDDEDVALLVKDSPQCMTFGLFMIWFASVIVNLGPTFLSGALAANAGTLMDEPSCPLVQGPYRHYVLNAIWILINLLCILLTIFHLHKLHRDFTRTNIEALRVQQLFCSPPGSQDCDDLLEVSPAQSVKLESYIRQLERQGISRVKMFIVITMAYLIFWGPLFVVTLANYTDDWKAAKKSMAHEVAIHVAFVHAFVNPLLFLVLHPELRSTVMDILCCRLRNYGESSLSPSSPSQTEKTKQETGGCSIPTGSKMETLIL